MSAIVRGAIVVVVLLIATLGEGGAAATSLLLQHVLLAFGVAIFAVAFPPADHASCGRPSIAWVVFALLAAAGAVVAPYAYAAWLVLIEIAAFGAMAWLAAGDPRTMASVLPPALAILASSHAVAAIVQQLRGSPRPASTFLNPNHFAAWLAAAALVLAGRALGRTGASAERWVYGGASLVALAAIVVTGSRGAALGLAAGAAVLAAATWTEMTSRVRRGAIAVAIVVALALSAAIASRFRGGADPYPYHRTKIWAAALRTLADSPLLGSGPGQFPTAVSQHRFPLEEAPLRYERGFRTPHSDALRSVCEFGLPAGVAVLAAVAFGLFRAFEARRGMTMVERGALSALAALLAQALVDDLSTRPAIMLTGAALAGMLFSRPVERPATPRSRTAATALAVLVVMALCVGEIAGFIAFTEAAGLPRGRLAPGQLAQLDSSLGWNPMRPDGWQRLAEHFAGDGRSWSAEDYAAAREATEHARRLQPADAFYARGAARVEAQACLTLFPFTASRARASRLYDEALGLAPWDATIPLEASRFLLQAGDPAGARRSAELALRIEPKAAAPRLSLARAILSEEGAAGAGRARRLLEEAAAYALKPGEAPSSPYDATLRSIDPGLAEAIRGELLR